MKPITLPIVRIDRNSRTAIVKSSNGRFPVHITMQKEALNDVKVGDDAVVVKSAVTGQWLMIDYNFCNDFTYAVHNSMQESGDLIADERGVPYGF